MLKSRSVQLAILIFLLVVLFFLTLSIVPDGIDWRDTYRPAALALLQGRSPYTVEIYFAAPWTLIPLLPFAILPLNVGRVLLIFVGVVAYAYTAYTLGARRLTMVFFLLSPPVLINLLNGNIDWLPLLGFILPPRWGLFLVLIKPQIGLAVAVFWLWEAWREGRLAQVWHTFWPVTLATLFSFALFGLWPLRLNGSFEIIQTYNTSLWPASLPVGLGLMAAAWRTRNIKFAMGAAPCFSPVVLLHAWGGALVALSGRKLEMVFVVLGLWIQLIFGLWTLEISF